MLKHTRVTGIPDVTRMGAAVSRPGIDPRTWVSYATVTAIGIDTEGVFVDVVLLPSRDPGTARLGSNYTGPGYGLYLPIGLGDEVLVEAPNGDPQHGLVISTRLHSPSDQLPQDAIDNPTDVVLVAKASTSIRMVVSDGGKLYLGSSSASDDAVRGTTYRQAEDELLNAMNATMTALTTAISALSAASPTLTGAPQAIAAWLASVAVVSLSAAELAAAVAAFSAGAPGYLSRTVEIAP